MQDVKLLLLIAIAGAIIACFVVCFFRSGGARFIVGLLLFVPAVFACGWFNEEVRHRDAMAKIREDSAVTENNMKRIQADLDAKPWPAGFAPATPASSAAPAPAPVMIARPAMVRRATPDPIAQNEAIRAKYGAAGAAR